MGPRSAECVNCGARSETAYCAECGQPRLARLTFPSLTRSALASVIDLDRGLLHTFRHLTLRPGEAVRDYLDGRPRRYTNPVQYAFVAASALGLAGFLSTRSPAAGTAEAELFQASQQIAGP